jgi:hypothetical protein
MEPYIGAFTFYLLVFSPSGKDYRTLVRFIGRFAFCFLNSLNYCGFIGASHYADILPMARSKLKAGEE